MLGAGDNPGSSSSSSSGSGSGMDIPYRIIGGVEALRNR
jgi:hypothetical protein